MTSFGNEKEARRKGGGGELTWTISDSKNIESVVNSNRHG